MGKLYEDKDTYRHTDFILCPILRVIQAVRESLDLLDQLVIRYHAHCKLLILVQLMLFLFQGNVGPTGQVGADGPQGSPVHIATYLTMCISITNTLSVYLGFSGYNRSSGRDWRSWTIGTCWTGRGTGRTRKSWSTGTSGRYRR